MNKETAEEKEHEAMKANVLRWSCWTRPAGKLGLD
jgi:hypothetical protein